MQAAHSMVCRWQMLNIHYEEDELLANGDETDDAHRVETTVFELAGRDSAGLLADVTRLLTDNGCDVRSAAVSTVPHPGGVGGEAPPALQQ